MCVRAKNTTMDISNDGSKEPCPKNVCKTTENLLEISSDTSINSGEEKCDIGPENSKKSCDTSPEDESVGDSLDEASKHDYNSSGPESCRCFVNSSKSCDINNLTSPSTMSAAIGDKCTSPGSDISKSLAFTIDFGDDNKAINSKKYNDIVQRFQKRHRRGVSLSKLDDKSNNSTSSVMQQHQSSSALTKAKPPLKKPATKPTDSDNSNSSPQVKLRDKSLLHSTKDSSQRHSWSPRTSSVITPKPDEIQNANQNLTNTFKPKSATLQKAFQDVRQHNNKNQKVKEIVCVQAPLEYAKHSDDDSVSDAGTYTVYGDNYTEEQKAQMCIDQLPKTTTDLPQEEEGFLEPSVVAVAATTDHNTNLNYCDTRQSNIEPDLERIEYVADNVQERRRKNILNVAYGPETIKTKTSYLEKIKSKVKNIGDRAFHKNRSPDKQVVAPATGTLDMGNFTSVTASGIFSKKPAAIPSTVVRRNSLTQSHIDSSEYVQNSNAPTAINEKLFNSYTDYEKARHHEYKLNIFAPPNRRTDSEKQQIKMSERLALETAETKNDWIQEWAKNARKNTATADALTQRKIKYMEKELDHNLEEKNRYDQFGDNLDRNYSSAKSGDRFKRGDLCDFSISDRQTKSGGQFRTPYVQNYYQTQYNRHMNYGCSDFESDTSPNDHPIEVDRNYEGILYGKVNRVNQTRPPVSPSKIPSPMHSLRRGRSCSANRDIHGSNTVSYIL